MKSSPAFTHPLEILLNSLISSALVYLLFGCDVLRAAFYTLLIAVAEFFYHWNVCTPRWIGTLIQRPESHRIHHQHRHHTQNYSDLPIWDMVFGTYCNAGKSAVSCGFDDWREDRFEDMLAMRDLHSPQAGDLSPLHFLPSCVGCSKRWACASARGVLPAEPGPTPPAEQVPRRQR